MTVIDKQIIATKLENLKMWRDDLATFKDCKISSRLEDMMVDVIDLLEDLYKKVEGDS